MVKFFLNIPFALGMVYKGCILFIVAIFFSCAVESQNTFYLAPQGNSGSDCTQESPCGTFAQILAMCADCEDISIYVQDGEYGATGNSNIIFENMNSVLIQGEGNSKFSGSSADFLFQFNLTSSIIINGIQIDDSEKGIVITDHDALEISQVNFGSNMNKGLEINTTSTTYSFFSTYPTITIDQVEIQSDILINLLSIEVNLTNSYINTKNIDFNTPIDIIYSIQRSLNVVNVQGYNVSITVNDFEDVYFKNLMFNDSHAYIIVSPYHALNDLGFEADNVIIHADHYYSALYLTNVGGDVIITNSIFNSNYSNTVTSQKDPESKHFAGGSLLLSNVSIISDTIPEEYNFNAFYSDAGKVITIEKSLIYGNIKIRDDAITFDNVRVTKPETRIEIKTQDLIQIKNSDFEGLTYIYVDSIYSPYYVNRIQNTSFTDCSSSLYSFASFLRTNWSISDSSFINCPGSTFIDVKNYVIDNCVFKNNDMTGGRLTKNGGSLYFDNANGTITSSQFESSTAFNGGAIVANKSSIILDSCSFTDCSATKYGGALYLIGDFSITSCTFDSCTAEDGGAIVGCSYFNTSKISSCSFDNNVATSDLGAVFSCSECNEYFSQHYFTNFTDNHFNGHHDAAIYTDDDDNIYCYYVNHDIEQSEADSGSSVPIWVYVVVSLVCILVLAILCIISIIVIVHKKRQRETFQIQVEDDFDF